MTAYYSENDPFAAAWLRNLIVAGMIAPGDVDERSVEDVVPLELAKYTQCHFFAGIGVWSYSLRSAGFPDDRRVWTGSCPCQPFSSAGQGKGFADERHLWPAFYHLISQCEPDIIFGEQVASGDGIAWLDLVQTDMEAASYAFGAVVAPAAGFRAPHIRHRTYWVAHNNNARLERRNERRHGPEQRLVGSRGLAGGVEHPYVTSQYGRAPSGQQSIREPRTCASWLANPVNGQLSQEGRGLVDRTWQPGIGEEFGWSGALNSFWDAADWLRCKDEHWRPVEPGTFPLAHGVADRMGLLRGYGNAIVAPQAIEFIKSALAYAP